MRHVLTIRSRSPKSRIVPTYIVDMEGQRGPISVSSKRFVGAARFDMPRQAAVIKALKTFERLRFLWRGTEPFVFSATLFYLDMLAVASLSWGISTSCCGVPSVQAPYLGFGINCCFSKS